jgi:hypothetical protein
MNVTRALALPTTSLSMLPAPSPTMVAPRMVSRPFAVIIFTYPVVVLCSVTLHKDLSEICVRAQA